MTGVPPPGTLPGGPGGPSARAANKARVQVAAVPIPHVRCGPACPWCPTGPAGDAERWLPGPGDVRRAVRARIEGERGGEGGIEITFPGGDFGGLNRTRRDELLDAAEGFFRNDRVRGVRVVLTPASAALAPIHDWWARGLRTVELAVLSLDDRVLAEARAPYRCAQVRGLVTRLRLKGLRVGLHLVPGVPADSHERAVQSARQAALAAPDFVRVLPALALRGTRLGELAARGRWTPMTLLQAVETCKEMVKALRQAGIEVARVGLQPHTDLRPRPEILAGPAHPSLRTLVEAALHRQLARDLMAQRCRFSKRFVLRVCPEDETWMRGPENSNLKDLKQLFRLESLAIVLDPAVPRHEVWGEPGGLAEAPGDRREAC